MNSLIGIANLAIISQSLPAKRIPNRGGHRQIQSEFHTEGNWKIKKLKNSSALQSLKNFEVQR